MIYDLKNEYQIPKFKEYVNKLFKERAVVEDVQRTFDVDFQCSARFPKIATCIFF